MKTEDGGRAFDCVKWTRRIRDQIHEDTAGMSREQRREWYSRRPTDPVLASLFDRRKPQEGGRVSARAAAGTRVGHLIDKGSIPYRAGARRWSAARPGLARRGGRPAGDTGPTAQSEISECILDKHNPAQFEFLNADDLRPDSAVRVKLHGLINDKDSAVDGKPTYPRIVIRRKDVDV